MGRGRLVITESFYLPEAFTLWNKCVCGQLKVSSVVSIGLGRVQKVAKAYAKKSDGEGIGGASALEYGTPVHILATCAVLLAPDVKAAERWGRFDRVRLRQRVRLEPDSMLYFARRTWPELLPFLPGPPLDVEVTNDAIQEAVLRRKISFRGLHYALAGVSCSYRGTGAEV
jgi:hypothetical protein